MLAAFPVFFRPVFFPVLMNKPVAPPLLVFSSLLRLCALCVSALSSSLFLSHSSSTNPVSYANRLPISRPLINRRQYAHIPMPLPLIRLRALLLLNCPGKCIQFRRKLIHRPEFLLKPLPANLARQPSLFIKR